MALVDIRPIYVSYSKGVNIANDKEQFTEPHIVYASVSEPVSYETIDDIGRIPEYDLTIIVDTGEKTEFIREDSRLWVETIPNDKQDNFDYVVARVGFVADRQLKLYCNAIAPSTQFLYYCNDGENIYQVKLFYNDLVAIVPKNMYFPVNKDTLVWAKKPSSVNSQDGLIEYIDRVERTKTYSYIFEEA